MKAPRIVALILCLAAMASTASADATLQWKFRKGKKYNYAFSMKMASTMMVQGQKIDTAMTQIIDMTWEIKDVEPDGSARMVQTIDRLRFKMTAPGGVANLDFDSREDKPVVGPQAATVGIFKAMVNAPMDMKMTVQGKVSDVKFTPEMAEAIKKAGAPMGGGSFFSEEGMKDLISRASITLPEGAIAQGKTWNTAFDTKMPMVGTMSADNTYTYLGSAEQTGRKVEKIGVDSKIEIKPDPNSPATVRLKAQESKGTIFFDNVEGFLRGSEINQKMQMIISVMNQEFTQDSETTVTMGLAKPETGPKTP
jgi:hypothetical protein